MQTGPIPPQYQPPPPSSMGHGVKIGIGIVVGILLVGLLAMGACGVACLGIVGGGGALVDRAQQEQAAKAVPIGEVGQKMNSGDIALTVEKVSAVPSLSRYEKAGSGQVYEVVEVLIENSGKEKYSVNMMSFTLKDGAGREYGVSYTASAPNFISTADLFPGDNLRGKIAFEVPKKADSYTLSYAPFSLLGNDDPIRIAFKN